MQTGHSAMWHLPTLALALLASLAHGDTCEQPSFRLASQQDVAAVTSCKTLTGDVVIAAQATGTIALDGVETIHGSLSNEACFDGASNEDNTRALLDGKLERWAGCNGLEGLKSNTLTQVTGSVTLRSLVGAKTIDLRNVKTIDGTLSVEYLPRLERMNLGSLERVESAYIRHNRQLANLTLSQLNNVTAALSTIELVDLAIYRWPRTKIRIHHYKETPPRRLQRLVAKDLPNIRLFEFNNADEIGLLEAHGFPNQTMQLTTDFQPSGPTPGQPFTGPVAAVDNMTITGFGGSLDVLSATNMKYISFENTNMTRINLWLTAGLLSMRIVKNKELYSFLMPQDMDEVQWESIIFDENLKLVFGEKSFVDSQPFDWSWGFNTSTLILRNSPMMPEWIKSRSRNITRVTDSLDITPAGNVSEVCAVLLDRAKARDLVFPHGGYTCGGQKLDPKISGGAMNSIQLYISFLMVVGSIATFI